LDGKLDAAHLGWCWCLSVADHAQTVTSLNDPLCGERYGLILILELELLLFLMELINLELEFATKELNPQINLLF